MSSPYIGEIRMFGGNFAPAGWAFCQGQLMPISENDALFTLIGTMYGGDGEETFGVPDLQGRVPIHFGTGSDGVTYQQGEKAGTESVTLTTQQLPAHTHPLLGSGNTASSNSPTNNMGGRVTVAAVFPYGTDAPFASISPQAVGPAGGNQPHENMQPFLVISYIISLFGIFPTQN